MNKFWSEYCVIVALSLLTLAIILNHLLTCWTKTGKQAFNYANDGLVIANAEKTDPRN